MPIDLCLKKLCTAMEHCWLQKWFTKMLHSVNKNEQTKFSSKKIEVIWKEMYKSSMYNSENFKIKLGWWTPVL